MTHQPAPPPKPDPEQLASLLDRLAKGVGVTGLALYAGLALLTLFPLGPGPLVALLSGLGINIASNLIYDLYQKLQNLPDQDQAERLKLLATTLEGHLSQDLKLRYACSQLLQTTDTLAIAEQIVRGNPALHGWLLTDIRHTQKQVRQLLKQQAETLGRIDQRSEQHTQTLDRIDEVTQETRDRLRELQPASQITPLSATAPAPPPHFTGRRQHLQALKAAVHSGGATVLTALQGMAGIGKTATARQLAHEVAADFPAGVFWGALPDHEGNPLPILRAWARACGHDLAAEPDLAILADQVRGLLATRQAEQGPLLVIVDDVRPEWSQAAQVLQRAVPAGAPCLLTTRDEALAALLGATVYRLDELPPDEALTLLQAHAGPAAVAAEPEAAGRLLKAVGYLPLAIELAGKRLALQARKPGYRLAALAEAVARRAAEALALPGHPGLAAIFAITYEALPAGIQGVFRWLGVFAAGPLPAASVAGVLGAGEARIEQLLDDLVYVALLVWGEQAGVYTLHPLLHQYAQTLLAQAGETALARERHRAYYLAYAQANAQIDPAAYDRLEAALPNLLAAVDFAVEVKAPAAVRAFGDALYGDSHFLDVRGYRREALALSEKAVAACRELGDRVGEAIHLGNLGNAYRTLSQVRKAIDHYEQALAIHCERGDRQGQANDLGNLGLAYLDLGQVERAIDYYRQALTIARELGDRRGEAAHLGNLGLVYHDLREVAKAIDYHQQALTIARELGDRRGEANQLGNLGTAYHDYHDLKEVAEAIDYLQQALAIHREIGDRQGEANELGNLGTAYRALGQVEQAIEHYQQALAIAQEIDDRRSEAIHSWNLGLLYAETDPARAVAHMSPLVEYEREIGHPDAEAHAQRLAQIQARLAND